MIIKYTSKRRFKPDELGPELAPSMTAANWTAGNSATLTNDANGNLKVAYNAVSLPYASKTITVVSGSTYRIKIACPLDGSAFPKLLIGSSLSGNDHLEWDNSEGDVNLTTFYVRASSSSLFIT